MFTINFDSKGLAYTTITYFYEAIKYENFSNNMQCCFNKTPIKKLIKCEIPRDAYKQISKDECRILHGICSLQRMYLVTHPFDSA
jgi:hypothetical protein